VVGRPGATDLPTAAGLLSLAWFPLPVRPQLRSPLLTMAVDLEAVADKPNDSAQWLGSAEPQRRHPRGRGGPCSPARQSRDQALLKQRDWGRSPEPAQLRDLPADSPGGGEARWFSRASSHSRPDPILEAGTATRTISGTW